MFYLSIIWLGIKKYIWEIEKYILVIEKYKLWIELMKLDANCFLDSSRCVINLCLSCIQFQTVCTYPSISFDQIFVFYHKNPNICTLKLQIVAHTTLSSSIHSKYLTVVKMRLLVKSCLFLDRPFLATKWREILLNIEPRFSHISWYIPWYLALSIMIYTR